MENLPASSLLQELRASLPCSASQLASPPPANSMPLNVNSMPSPLTMFSSPLLDSSSSLSLAAHQVNSLQVFDLKMCQKRAENLNLNGMHCFSTPSYSVCILSEPVTFSVRHHGSGQRAWRSPPPRSCTLSSQVILLHRPGNTLADDRDCHNCDHDQYDNEDYNRALPRIGIFHTLTWKFGKCYIRR